MRTRALATTRIWLRVVATTTLVVTGSLLLWVPAANADNCSTFDDCFGQSGAASEATIGLALLAGLSLLGTILQAPGLRDTAVAVGVDVTGLNGLRLAPWERALGLPVPFDVIEGAFDHVRKEQLTPVLVDQLYGVTDLVKIGMFATVVANPAHLGTDVGRDIFSSFIVNNTGDTVGDQGGKFTTEQRGTFAGGDGTHAVIEALEHTHDSQQVQGDEFEIIKHVDGRYTVVLPGVTDISDVATMRLVGPLQSADTVRDTNEGAAESLGSHLVKDNEYAVLVRDWLINESGIPAGSDLALVGHSYGSDTALDLAADPEFNESFAVTHVVAAAYASQDQLANLPADTEVLVLMNTNDMAVKVEGLGLTLEGENRAPEPVHGTHTVVEFDGGTDGVGHEPSNYIAELEANEDPAVQAFLESYGNQGYGVPGTPVQVDVSRNE